MTKKCPVCNGKGRILERRPPFIWWICVDCDHTWTTKG